MLRLNSSLKDLKTPRFWAAVLGELVGVMFLVLMGCGSVMALGEKVGISLCFGISVATMVWCLASVSGGHINPAVTVAMFLLRRISLARCLFYIVAQCVGSVLGTLLLKGISCEFQRVRAVDNNLTETFECALGFTELGKGVTPGVGFFVELLVTFVLVLTVFATTDSSRRDLSGSGPLAIGLSVTMCHLAAIPLTGSSMNTARTFGPAVIGGGSHLDNHWVYWIGPILGGIIAGFLYEFLFADNASPSKFASWLKDSDYGEPEGEEGEEEEAKHYEMKGQADQS